MYYCILYIVSIFNQLLSMYIYIYTRPHKLLSFNFYRVKIKVTYLYRSIGYRFSQIINLLLTEREGRTGEYWPEVATVPQANTKTTEGQYSPVRLEQARLVSSLLYGTRLVQTHFRSVKFKGLPARDDASNSERIIEHLPNVLPV